MKVPRSIEELRDDYLNTRARMEESLSLMAKAAMFSIHTLGLKGESDDSRRELCLSKGLNTLPYLDKTKEANLAYGIYSTLIKLLDDNDTKPYLVTEISTIYRDFYNGVQDGINLKYKHRSSVDNNNLLMISEISFSLQDGGVKRHAQTDRLASPMLYKDDQDGSLSRDGLDLPKLKKSIEGNPNVFAEKLDFIIDAFNEQNPGDPFNPGHYGLNKYENYSLHSSPSNIQDPTPYPPAPPDNDWLWRIGD